MKKSKLFLSLVSLCFAFAVMCFGIYAAEKVDYQISGSISYSVSDCYVEVQTKVYTYPSHLLESELAAEVERVADTSFVTTPSGLSLLKTSSVYSSLNAGSIAEYDYDDLEDLAFTTGNNSVYAYFFVINIKNLSSDINVWAVMQDELTTPDNTYQINNGLQQNIAQSDSNGKNIVIGVGLNDETTGIDSDHESFSYRIKIGTGVLAEQDFMLEKLTISGSSANVKSTAKGVVVIPDGYTSTNISYFPNVTHLIMGKDITSTGSYNSSNAFTSLTKIVIPDGFTTSNDYYMWAGFSNGYSKPTRAYTLELGDAFTSDQLTKFLSWSECNYSKIKVSPSNVNLLQLGQNSSVENFIYVGTTLKFIGYGADISNIPTSVISADADVFSRNIHGILNVPAQITALNETRGLQSVVFDSSVTTLVAITLQNVNSVDFNNVQTISGNLSITNCPNLSMLNMSNVQTVSGNLTIQSSTISTLTLSTLQTVSGVLSIDVEIVNLPSLTSVGILGPIDNTGKTYLKQLNIGDSCVLTADNRNIDFRNDIIEKVTLPSGAKFAGSSDGNNAFKNCTSLKEIILLGDFGSGYWGYFPSNVEKVTFKSTTVPTNLDKSVIPTTATVYVPSSALSAYTTWLDGRCAIETY